MTYEQSERIDELTTALAAFHAEAKNPHFDATNPHFKSKFVTLASITDGYRGALAECGLVVDQMLVAADPGHVGILTQISHSSGQWRRSTFQMPIGGRGTPQDAGSAISYGRRYALMAALDLAGDEDDDGEAATAPSRQPSRPENGSSRAQEARERAQRARQQAKPSAQESAPSAHSGVCPDHGPFDDEACPECGVVEGQAVEEPSPYVPEDQVFALIERAQHIGVTNEELRKLLPGQPYRVTDEAFDLAMEAVQRGEELAKKRQKLPDPPKTNDGAETDAQKRLREARERRAAAKARLGGKS